MAALPVIDSALVRRLVATQFPAWADLPVRRVRPGGWDHRTFRLGEALCVRLPSAHHYASQVNKEQHWLPRLAPQLPLPIPEPVAHGAPGEGYPLAWSVYRWIDGVPAERDAIADPVAFAITLAEFLTALQAIDAGDGPPPGAHNFQRGGPLAHYADEVERALVTLAPALDAPCARELFAAALATRWSRPPVWVHGDVAAGNLLLRDGVLAAVIDFGCCAVGDPACDLTIAWTLLDGEARTAFREAVTTDADCWRRARGWALWKALVTITDDRDPDGEAAAVVAALLAEHGAA